MLLMPPLGGGTNESGFLGTPVAQKGGRIFTGLNFFSGFSYESFWTTIALWTKIQDPLRSWAEGIFLEGAEKGFGEEPQKSIKVAQGGVGVTTP